MLQTSHTWSLERLAFTNDSKLIASTSGQDGDGTIKLWEVSSRRQLRTLVGHTQGVTAISLSSNGKLLASASNDDTIRIWSIENGREEHKLYAPAHWVSVLLFSPDGRYLVSAAPPYGRPIEPGPDLQRCNSESNPPDYCLAKDFAIWDVQAGKLIANLSHESSGRFDKRPWHVAFSADGEFLAFGTEGNFVRLWDLESAKELPPLTSSSAPLVVTENGHRLATTSADGGVVVWDLMTREAVLHIKEPGVPVVFANHDTRLITSTGTELNQVIKFWNATNGTEEGLLNLDPALACADCSLHFSRDGRWLGRGGFGEPKLVLWDLTAPQRVPRLWRNLNTPIAFSPDGHWLAANTSSFFNSRITSNSIWLLDLQSGDESCATANRG